MVERASVETSAHVVGVEVVSPTSIPTVVECHASPVFKESQIIDGVSYAGTRVTLKLGCDTCPVVMDRDSNVFKLEAIATEIDGMKSEARGGIDTYCVPLQKARETDPKATVIYPEALRS